MASFFKKILVLKKPDNVISNFKGYVIVENSNNTVSFTFDFPIKNNINYTIFISGSDKNIKVLESQNKHSFKIYFDDFNLNSGITVAVFDEESLICYNEYNKSFYSLSEIIDYAKTEREKFKKERNFTATSEKINVENPGENYNDELIAEENYYKLNNERKDIFNQDVSLLENDKKQEKIEENKPEPREYEKDLRTFESGNFYEKIKDKLDEIFINYEQTNDLIEGLENSKFVKIHYGENKYYYVGKVYENDKVKYLCYGIMDYYKAMPNELLSNFCFIPISNFELSGKGFYLIFQDAITGEIVKKQR